MGNNQNGEAPSVPRRNMVIPLMKQPEKAKKKTSLDELGGQQATRDLPKGTSLGASRQSTTFPAQAATVTHTALPSPANFPILKEDFPDLDRYRSHPLSDLIPVSRADFEPIYRRTLPESYQEVQVSFGLGTFTGWLKLASSAQEASGLFQFSNGDIFKGEVTNGLFVAPGTYLFADGTVYIGNFFENKFEGTGEIRFANGESYQGSFSRGRIDGRGQYRWKDGTVFQGIFKNGIRQGVGEFFFASGGHFVGDLLDDQVTGMGRLTGRFGVTYEGHFSGGKRAGKGVLRNGVGDTLKARFFSDKPEGQGILIEGGKTFEVTFQAGFEISRESV